MEESKSAWALPDKYSDDLVDEHGNKMSKRCGQSVAHGLEKICVVGPGMHGLHGIRMGAQCFKATFACCERMPVSRLPLSTLLL